MGCFDFKNMKLQCALPGTRVGIGSLLCRRRQLVCKANAAAHRSSMPSDARVVLKLQKRVPFGQCVAVLSSDSEWSIDHATRLDWVEGERRTCIDLCLVAALQSRAAGGCACAPYLSANTT